MFTYFLMLKYPNKKWLNSSKTLLWNGTCSTRRFLSGLKIVMFATGFHIGQVTTSQAITKINENRYQK